MKPNFLLDSANACHQAESSRKWAVRICRQRHRHSRAGFTTCPGGKWWVVIRKWVFSHIDSLFCLQLVKYSQHLPYMCNIFAIYLPSLFCIYDVASSNLRRTFFLMQRTHCFVLARGWRCPSCVDSETFMLHILMLRRPLLAIKFPWEKAGTWWSEHFNLCRLFVSGCSKVGVSWL